MKEPSNHLQATIGQYVLITNDENKLLLLERARSKNWSLPGGRLNKEERNWKQALHREVQEETGLTISDVKPFCVKLIEDQYQVKYCTYFLVKCVNLGELNISIEHSSSRWVTREDMESLVIDDEPKVREVLEEYFENLP